MASPRIETINAFYDYERVIAREMGFDLDEARKLDQKAKETWVENYLKGEQEKDKATLEYIRGNK